MPRKLLRSTLVLYPVRASPNKFRLDGVTQRFETTPDKYGYNNLMPQTAKQDTELLEAALIGFQLRRDQVEQKIAELRSQISGNSASRPAPAAGAPATKKRTMSASARRRIALAQKKRWAVYKAEHGTKPAPPKAKKRVISAAGRARIVAATKKRWAAYRKAQEAKKSS